MQPDLSTSNVFLGIIAVSSVVQMLAIGIVCAGVFLLSRRLTHLIKTVEEQHLPPAAQRVQAILDDVNKVTSTVRTQTDRMDTLARWTLGIVRRCVGDV